MATTFKTKANWAKGTLAAGITDSATDFTVDAGYTLPESGIFRVVLWDIANYPDPANDPNAEISDATYSAGVTFDFSGARGLEGTSAVAHSSDAAVRIHITKGYLDEYETAINSAEDAIDLNTTHRGSDGTDHTFINQDVTSTSSPTFVDVTLDTIDSVDSIQFDTEVSPARAEGKMFWNSTDGTMNIGMSGSDVDLQVGQEILLPRGKAIGSAIDNGELVYISGASGSRPELTLAKADASATSKGTIAMATEDIVENANGYYTSFGLVRGIPVPTATFSNGDILYLSKDTAGAFTNVSPEDPNFVVKVGFVILAHDTDGIVFVTINQRSNTAKHIRITDANNYYTGTEVETALQEALTRDDWNNNGFKTKTTSTLTWTDSGPDRTLSIQPTVTSFDYWIAGVKYTTTGDTVQITDVEGLHLITYVGDTLTAEANPTASDFDVAIRTKCLVSILYWDTSASEAIYVGEERHGISMSPAVHNYHHFIDGLRYISGLGLNTLSVDGAGATADAQFGVDSGSVTDEDLRVSISAITSTTGLPIYYMLGASAEWQKHTEAGFSVRTLDGTSADRLAWNEYTGGAWQLTEADSGKYVLCHVFATTEKDKPMIAIMGQATYATKPAAREGATTEIHSLVLDDVLFPEVRPIATVIFQTNTAYASDVNARIVSTAEGADYIDWRDETISKSEISTSDHGSLTGLADDDHPQYILADGTRAFSGNQDFGTNDITGVGSLGVTGTRLTKGWFTDLEVTNSIAGSITGTATNLSGTPALPDGTTATTQAASDNTTKLATTAYVDAQVTTEDFWDRTGTNLLPNTAGDDIGSTGTRINKIWATDLEVTNAIAGSITGTAAIATGFTCTDNESENLGCNIVFVDGPTGTQGAETDGDLTYNPSTGTVASTIFLGALTGNASTATALETARTIGGTSFDGTANIVPATITVADTTDTTSFVGLWESATGDLAPKTDAGLTYNAGTGMLTATGFTGPLTGQADTVATITGLAPDTATTQAAQPNITSVGTLTSLDTSGAITADGDISASTNGSSEAVPRVFGFSELSATEACRLQFGDEHNGFQNGYAQDVQIYSYWGLVLAGGMQNYNSGFVPPAFSKTTDTGVLILSTNDIGDDPGAGATNIVTLGIKAVASQTNNLTEWRSSADAVLADVDASGNFTMPGLTMGGNIVMADNSVTGIDTLTFTDTAGTVAGIQNGNLVDKSASETISGEWTYSTFPITPSAAPDADYEVANKKYVDDQAAGANTALSNLAAVAINDTLVSDTDNTDALGTAAIGWSDLFLGNLSVITWSTAPSTADVTLTHAANTLTFAGGTIALGTATATGGLTGNVTGDCSGEAGTVATITGLAPDTATTQATQGNITSLGTLTSLTMGGDIDMGGKDIDNGGVIFLTEQAAADADVAGKGQIWVKTAAPNELWFTDDAGSDVQLGLAGATPTDITVADESTDTTCFPLFVTAATGDLGPKTAAGLTFNSATDTLTVTAIAGPLTGNVTGNVTGSSGSCTGESATVATIAGLAPDTATTQAAQPNITSVGTLTTLTVDDITINANTISSGGASTLAITPTAGQSITFDGTITLDAGVILGATSITSTAFVGALTGEADTVTTITGLAPDTATTQAAQPNITSLGTLTTLSIDNITINGNDISSTAGTDLTITPLAGEQIVLDGTIIIDAGVVTGATSITSTAFVGALTGNADTVTGFTPASGSLTLAGADAVTLTTTAATSVTLPTAGTLLANVAEDTTPELGGEMDCGAHSIGFTQQTATGDGTTTIDWKLGNKFKFTFGAFNETFTFTAPTNPCNLLLMLVQDGTGSRTATWPATVKWPASTAPTLTTTAAGVDIVSMYFDGTSYHAVASLAFGVPV